MHDSICRFFSRTLSVCCLFSMSLLLACAPAKPVPLDIPDLSEAARIDLQPASTLSWDASGSRLLVSGGSLRLISLSSGGERLLSEKPAGLTAWSPGGERIAVAAPHDGAEDATRINILSGASGEQLETRSVSGRAAALFWANEKEVLVAAATLKVFSFGANLKFLLHRFEVGGGMSSAVLSDATVKPGTANYLGNHYERVFHVDFSLLRDEIIYTRFHDPPEAFPYLRLVVRHLVTGEEKGFAELSLYASGIAFAGDGESVFFDGGSQGVMRKSAWSDDAGETVIDGAGSRSLVAGGSYLLVGNELYEDGQRVASLPEGAVYSLSPAGNYLAARQETLVQVFALPTAAGYLPQIGDEAKDKLLRLRRWRSQGLITPAEYLERKQRIMKQ